MEFHDFQIRAWGNDSGLAQVLVHSSPAGAMTHPQAVDLNSKRLYSLQGIFRDSPRYPSSALDAGGRELAAILFPDPIQELLIRSLEGIDPDDGLRIRLCLDSTPLDLPWEYLILPDTSSLKPPGGFLALEARISLVREPPQPGRERPSRQKKQSLLFFGSRNCDSQGKDIWDTAGERDRLFGALQPVGAFLKMESVLSNETDCQNALMQSKGAIDIFHYSGHTDVENNEGYLLASDVRPGAGRPFTRLYAASLGPLLRRAKTNLAVFSACNSGNWAFVEPLIRAGVSVVIGAQGQVYVDVAIAFFQQLYSALAIGLSLDEAVTWARLHLLEPGVLPDSLRWQWGTFMVYMQTPEAVLFPKPRRSQLAEQQNAARRARQVTVINVIQNIGRVEGVVYGVSAGSIGTDVHTEVDKNLKSSDEPNSMEG